MSSLATLILFSSCSLYKSINRPHPLRSGSTWTLCTTFAFLRIHTIWVGAVVLESLEKILTSSHFSLSFFPVRSRSTDPIPSLTAVRVPLPVVADWTFCTAFPFFDHSNCSNDGVCTSKHIPEEQSLCFLFGSDRQLPSRRPDSGRCCEVYEISITFRTIPYARLYLLLSRDR